MNVIWLIAGMGAGVFALRISGLLLHDVRIPDRWEQSLQFLPVALISALVVLSLLGPSGEDTSRIIAAGGAGIVVYRTRRMWACIASGLIFYWILRFIS